MLSTLCSAPHFALSHFSIQISLNGFSCRSRSHDRSRKRLSLKRRTHARSDSAIGQGGDLRAPAPRRFSFSAGQVFFLAPSPPRAQTSHVRESAPVRTPRSRPVRGKPVALAASSCRSVQ